MLLRELASEKWNTEYCVRFHIAMKLMGEREHNHFCTMIRVCMSVQVPLLRPNACVYINIHLIISYYDIISLRSLAVYKAPLLTTNTHR